jgi:hypothetical protein
MGDAIDANLNEILGDQDDEPTPAPTPTPAATAPPASLGPIGRAVLDYTATSNPFGRAVRIFPCRSGEKEPAVRGGYKIASNNPDQIRAWWERWRLANIGCVCGLTGILVIDIDNKLWRDPPLDGEASFAKLVETLGPLPPTLEQRTWSGGRQLFFSGTNSITSRANAFGAEFPGVDIKDKAGYVVVPPSYVIGAEKGAPKDGRYAWVNDLPLADLPEAWLAALRKEDRTRQKAESNGSGGTGDSYVLPEAIKKGDRRDELIRYGGILVWRGWSDDEIEQLLREADRTRCKPPYAGSSQASKLDKIIREVQGFPKPKPIEDEIAELEAQAQAFKTLSTDEVLALLIEAENQPDPVRPVVPVTGFEVLTGAAASGRREIIPNLVVENDTTSIYGHGDSTKSLTSLLVGVVARTDGLAIGPLRAMRTVKVAVLDWETDRETWDDRLGKLCRGLGIPVPEIYYRRMDRPLVDCIEPLAAELRALGVELVILDSLMYALGGSLSAGLPERVISFFNACRRFAPAARFVANHITAEQATDEPGKARPFGGAFAHNGPRLTWRLTRDRDETEAALITFTCTKGNNLARVPPSFTLRYEGTQTGGIRAMLATRDIPPESLIGAPLPERILNFVERADDEVTLDQIADGLAGVPGSTKAARKETIGRTLRRLVTESRLASGQRPIEDKSGRIQLKTVWGRRGGAEQP